MKDDCKDEDYVDLLDSGLLVPHYLIHCYLYYEEGTSLISDKQFDELAQRLWQEWDCVDHVHKDLIDPEALTSGGSYLSGKYPIRVKNSALSLVDTPAGKDLPPLYRPKSKRRRTKKTLIR